MCQEFPKEKWVDARREDILDAPYFHVVFTVPEELNPIIYSNQKFLYAALYHAASDTLSELAADSKYLGTDIGYICILHTWGSREAYFWCHNTGLNYKFYVFLCVHAILL